MNSSQKKSLLEQARQRIKNVREYISAGIKIREERGQAIAKSAIHANPGDAIAAHKIHAHNMETVENLKALYPSPYFTRCEFVVDGVNKQMYFGKFSFGEANIYSWITPAAALRFENVGPAGYKRPDGKIQNGELLSKDQYLIVDGNLKFYATESVSEARELIYQENFTTKKNGFILPEVVEKMERAQDTVIRAPWRGPFLITGPAGSGKTTLALHRVAYLMQAPETAEYFSADVILVLVQDAKTKDYFGQLLPDLGIKNVAIKTFTDWALEILELPEHSGDINGLYDTSYQYQNAKLQALRSLNEAPYSKNVYTYLTKIYAPYFTATDQKTWMEQKSRKILDRVDLTILLQTNKKRNGGLNIAKEYYEETAGGSYRKKKGTFPVMLNLAIVDEFQNYLPEQLEIINGVLNPRLQSAVYVGDVAQQTRLGTIRDLRDMTIVIEGDRQVKLEKVYRNTKQILEYARSLGFNVDIPEELKNGPAVTVKQFNSAGEEIEFAKQFIDKANYDSVGILARDKSYLEQYKTKFKGNAKIYCLTYQEAQGVEFDLVVLVGPIDRAEKFGGELEKEIKKIERDLLYIALTRAMREMVVMVNI